MSEYWDCTMYVWILIMLLGHTSDCSGIPIEGVSHTNYSEFTFSWTGRRDRKGRGRTTVQHLGFPYSLAWATVQPSWLPHTIKLTNGASFLHLTASSTQPTLWSCHTEFFEGLSCYTAIELIFFSGWRSSTCIYISVNHVNIVCITDFKKNYSPTSKLKP